ncbi:hypothetical protein BASA81_003629 [Batrachochytrium salamandrivorans]|nr:hypothetical protein BASA81_003629 [Batrachochytrium salamandrivorans]
MKRNRLGGLLAVALVGLFILAAPLRPNARGENEDDLVRHFLTKTSFREAAMKRYETEHVDEVVLLLHSGKKSVCNTALMKEAIRSGLALRRRCVRCDFDITLVANEPIYSAFLSAKADNGLVAGVFTSLVQSQHYAQAEEIFAAHKPRDSLLYATKPFALFMDADIVANDGAFPEVLFDMLHKDQDLVMPIDWAHRHGNLWGRGVPGLCTCIFGFMNSPNVRRVVQAWQREIERFTNDQTYREEITTTLLSSDGRQFRDQELLSLVFFHHSFPDVKVYPLTMDWVCAEQGDERGVWTEGSGSHQLSPSNFAPLFRTKCKTLHFHSTSARHFTSYVLKDWLENLGNVGEPLLPGELASQHGCSGARRKV